MPSDEERQKEPRRRQAAKLARGPAARRFVSYEPHLSPAGRSHRVPVFCSFEPQPKGCAGCDRYRSLHPEAARAAIAGATTMTEWSDDDFDMLSDGAVVGRIFKVNAALWGFAVKTPIYSERSGTDLRPGF